MDICTVNREEILADLFSDIPNQVTKNTYDAFKSNPQKNAFNNVLAPDHSRVILKTNTDYINANWLLNNKFVATQNPLKNTIEDFFRMCMENSVNIIVNLNNSCNYLCCLTDKLVFQNFAITIIKHKNLGNIVIRRLAIKHKGTKSVHQLVHIHLRTWPDFGLPDKGDMKRLLKIVKKYDTDDKPIVVHCRAGLGRTGVFITIYYSLLKQGSISIIPIIKEMRKNRDNMVQTLEQAMFCQEFLLELNKPKVKKYDLSKGLTNFRHHVL